MRVFFALPPFSTASRALARERSGSFSPQRCHVLRRLSTFSHTHVPSSFTSISQPTSRRQSRGTSSLNLGCLTWLCTCLHLLHVFPPSYSATPRGYRSPHLSCQYLVFLSSVFFLSCLLVCASSNTSARRVVTDTWRLIPHFVSLFPWSYFSAWLSRRHVSSFLSTAHASAAYHPSPR